MPKFELNPRTGMMEPKKDEQIYFAGSMGGGLRIDDHKNNVKYIIERDGRITNLFGIRGENLNIYDMRDARIIADRVVRMFGKTHRYSDFHYFLKGYRTNESVIRGFNSFIEEGMWKNVVSRSNGGNIRMEDGFSIGITDDGVELICPPDARECGDLIEFNGEKYYYFEDCDSYLAVFNEAGTDTVFRLNLDSDPGKPNMDKSFEIPEIIRVNDFSVLKAIVRCENWSDDDLDGLMITPHSGNGSYEIESESSRYLVFDSEDNATDYAVKLETEILTDMHIDKDIIKHWRTHLGDDFLDAYAMENVFRESCEYYYDDLDDNDKIDELLRYDIINDTEEYFDRDDEGELDHELPKFDPSDYESDYVDARINEMDDIVEEYILNFGYDDIDSYIDFDRLARLIVECDGRGFSIFSEDGEENIELVGNKEYYIYRLG